MTHVRRWGRVSAWVVARGNTPATVAIFALFGVLLQPMQAAGTYIEACENAWDDAPAHGYCTSSSITRVNAGSSAGNCLISVSTCSITVSVDGTDTTFTPTWPSNYGYAGDGLSVADTGTVDICFASSNTTNSGYTATVNAGCASTETDSASATADGLD